MTPTDQNCVDIGVKSSRPVKVPLIHCVTVQVVLSTNNVISRNRLAIGNLRNTDYATQSSCKLITLLFEELCEKSKKIIIIVLDQQLMKILVQKQYKLI